MSDVPAGAVLGEVNEGDGDDREGNGVRPVRKRKRNSLLEWLIVIVVAMTSALVVRAFVVQQFAVDGTSMMTTLHNGDRVLVNKLSYRLHDPNRGDVVVLKTIEGVGERDLIKRVVGLPGETISYAELRARGRRQGGRRAVPRPRGGHPDGVRLAVQRHRRPTRPRVRHGRQPWRLQGQPRGQVGQIDYGDLVGRAFVVIWPFGDWKWL